MKRYFTSEAVTAGHPDKLCDQIADGVLDELLKQDPKSRCACEVTAWPSGVHIMGEITSSADVDYKQVARKVIQRIGYTKSEYGFCDDVDIFVSLHKQSDDIAMGVNKSLYDSFSLGSGDQGMMFGYASDETDEYMPLSYVLARRLTMRLTDLRERGILPYLRPDGKSQVTIEYDGDSPKRIDAVVVSAQHDPEVDLKRIREDIIKSVIIPVLPANLLDADTRFLINPTGRFVLGGPAADTGLTGRKIIADTYGGHCRHGGGSFSGKDPSKVDRTAALVLRNIAKTIVAAKAASKCELQISYAIGVSDPISLSICTFGTGKISDDIILEWVRHNYDLRPGEMIRRFNLLQPIYLESASNGAFGRSDIIFPWETIDEKALYDLKSML